MKLEQLDEGRLDWLKLGGKAKKADSASDVAHGVDAASDVAHARPTGWLDKWKKVLGMDEKPPVQRVDPNLDDIPVIDPIPSPAKPKIKLQPGETLDQAIERTRREMGSPIHEPKVEVPPSAPSRNSNIGVDVKDKKRGFADRVSDKLSRREPGTTTYSEVPKVELPKDIDVPPKMRKPADEVPSSKVDVEPKATEPTATKSNPEIEPEVDASPKTPLSTKAKRAAWGYTGLAAADAGIEAGTNPDASFGKEFVKNMVAPAVAVHGAYKDLTAKPGDENKNDKGQEIVPASTSATAPGSDEQSVPVAKESILSLLKLSGQRPITERDSIMGIVKPKEIVTLTESAELNECGPMGMGGSQSASFSINATAGSGVEVANMLTSILQLAGVKPVGQEMMPQVEPMPMVKALSVLGGEEEPMEPSEPDSMNGGTLELDSDGGEDEQQDDGTVTVRNVDTGEEFTGKNVTQPGKITVKNVSTGEEFDGREATEEEYSNTPNDPTDVPEWDPEKMVFRPNKPQQGNRMDGTMPKGVPAMAEAKKEPGLADMLLKEYEAFKNGQ